MIFGMMIKRVMMSVVSHQAAPNGHHVAHVADKDEKRRRSQKKCYFMALLTI